MLDVADRLALHELLHLYGHIVDDRAWDALDQVFIADVVYDARDFDMPVTRSLAELVAEWTSDEGMRRHPLAHHVTNIVVSEDDDGTVRVRSKGIGVGAGGRVGSVTYDDVVVRTTAGWRLAASDGDPAPTHGMRRRR
ncbi:MAG: nuclear transport factor 2 family protein [Acidimicrobiales bacterium]